MLALSIRQPYAELILRGIKTVEFRSRPTRIVGERFLIYASKSKGQVSRGTGQVRDEARRDKSSGRLPATRPLPLAPDYSPTIWSRDLELPDEAAAEMIALANGLRLFPAELPTGVIVGSAETRVVAREGRAPLVYTPRSRVPEAAR